MDCDDYREALSARLDGEDSPVPAERLDAHLAGCAGCRSWHQRAVELNRTLRVRAVTPIPDATGAVLAAAPPRRDRRRIALAGIGACQLLLGISQAAGLGGAHLAASAGHLFNESTAWNLAMGLGLAWTAWRTSAAAGMLPVLSAFLLVLTGFSVHDLLLGTVTAGRLATHGLLLAGLVALVAVRRGEHRPGPARAVPGPVGSAAPASGAEPVARPGDLGPTAYRRTA
ncbi:zf-HC2 domain-containing protein [Saccharopolyspora griseoalba]|uniref:Zf-HC2 domain-containing protein n=1 Tax=Saccharopolyspora griseoalba TaxID=1431848 RepID=A0ABW2LMC8_9PSEU